MTLAALDHRQRRTVKIAGLKRFALDSLPTTSALRQLLLTEPDELEVVVFISKAETWLKLCRIEFQ
jgi:hypothetical protein